MECPHCHGVMVKKRLYDVLENDGQPFVSGWRWGYPCVVCGSISDWVVEQNWRIARRAVTVDERTRNAEAGAARAMTPAPVLQKVILLN